jgi:hypothetical protein
MKRQALHLAAICSLAFTLNSNATVHYVDLNCTNRVPPYIVWSTAATNIQDAVDSSTNGDQVLVTNGVYRGAVATTNAITIRSVNGAAVTFIDGNYTNSCVILADGAALNGFTVTNGYSWYGAGVRCASTNVLVSDCLVVSNVSCGNVAGGVYSGTVSNCTLSYNTCRTINGLGSGGGAGSSVLYNCILYGNLAGAGGAAVSSTLFRCVLRDNQANAGGATYACVLNNCLVLNNSTFYDYRIDNCAYGGGLYGSTATNCTIVGNTSSQSRAMYPSGGGAFISTLMNCIVYGNKYGSGAVDNWSGCNISSTCTTPLPSDGANNFTNAPLFVNQSGGDFHLQSTSPCINAGDNAYVTVTNDFDGNPRIKGGTVDVGAYEFQNPSSVISYAWLKRYGLTNNGSANYADTDGDDMNNWQEWKTGTNPTNAASVMKMTSAAPTNNPAGLVVTWQSVSGMNYFIQRSSELGTQPPFSTIQSNIVGQTGTTSYTDTTATNGGPFFYRVGVGN